MKVNRLLSEGRASFRERYESIASGAECDRWAPVLSRLCDGEASVRELVSVRRHLRRCPGCRATLRGYVDAPGRVEALVPAAAVAGLASAPGPDGPLAGLLEAIGGGLGFHERTTLVAGKLGAAAEAATSGKLAAVAASTAALAGGGVVVERAVHRDAPAPAASKSLEEAGAPAAAPAQPEPVSPEAGGGGSRGPSPASSAPPAATTEPRAQSPAPRPPEPRAGDFGVEGTPAPSASEAGTGPSRTAPAPAPVPSAPAGSTGSAGDEFGP